MPRWTLPSSRAASSTGLRDAYRYAVTRAGLVALSPQIAFLGAYSVVYGAALLSSWDKLGEDGPVVAFAVGVAFLSLLIGLALGWRRFGPSIRRAAPVRQPQDRRMTILALALTAIGAIALALYFIRIGGIPLFMASAEQGRVDAADRGGAPLRVLGLLTLLGSWLLVGIAVRSRRILLVIASALVVLAVAAAWTLTANRAPAFVAIEVAVFVALLAGGRIRLPWSWTAALAVTALAAVLAAGGVGAVRLASLPVLGPPPPGATSVGKPEIDYPKLVVISVEGYLRVPVQNLRSTMAAVPEAIGWRLGMTYLQPIMTVMPGKQTTFDADLKEALDQHYAGGGTVPGLLGESYANFGPLGWAIVPAVVAVFLIWLFALAVRLDTVSGWALYAFTIALASNGTLGGLIVASPFPYLAVAVLGGATFLEDRLSQRTTATQRPAVAAPVAASDPPR